MLPISGCCPRRLRTLALIAGLLLLVRAWGIEGWLRPIRVRESSMAPSVLGEHAVVRCPVCQRDYAVEPFDPTAEDRRGVCPGCGTMHWLAAPRAWRPGQRVLIAKWSRWFPLRLRWRVVAVRNPRDPRDWLVKRLVGLPGETIQLRDGDLYVNGKIRAKSLDEFRDLALPVFDTAQVPLSAAPAVFSRWRSPSSDEPWQLRGDALVSRPGNATAWSWLAYQGADLPGRRPQGILLLDDYAFNQTLSRPLHPVRDFLLRCRLRDFRQGRIACQVRLNGQLLEVVWDLLKRQVTLRIDGMPPQQRWLPYTHAAPCTTMEFALCDGWAHFALDQRLIIKASLPTPMTEPSRGIERIRLGTQQAAVVVARIELLRDVHYLVPPSWETNSDPGGYRLAADEFFVLGDNTPVSEDSRDFGPVRRADLLGTVLDWPNAAR